MLKENQEQVVEPVSLLQLKHQNLKLQKNPNQPQLRYVLTSQINTGSNKNKDIQETRSFNVKENRVFKDYLAKTGFCFVHKLLGVFNINTLTEYAVTKEPIINTCNKMVHEIASWKLFQLY